MSEDTITIEVDGQSLPARKGAMLIEVTDAAGIHIPRFCYHDKLSIAANCRMCLVEVEKAPKPLPACATPVMDGMKVFTRSARAIAAQRGTMEFLLINHPLDCPICDQGGECELQDVAMGYGQSVSRFTETKRVVLDRDIGPLISTDMTRCIHCTRCVRFGDEIAGLRELGMTGRGEDARIGTYVAKAVTSEMSGNVIDLCPVGALTAKPSRYVARAWELLQHPGIAAHDCVGSNVYYHTRDNLLVRVVPRESEAINEVWLSDRDRFSYQGLASDDRLRQPMVRKEGELQAVEWDEAFQAAAELLRASVADSTDDLATLVSPSITLEEQFLLQKLVRSLGGASIDHRLRQLEFSTRSDDPVMPWLGQNLADLEGLQSVLVIGMNPRKDQPLVAHRLRKAALAGASVAVLNVRQHPQHYPTSVNKGLTPAALVQELAGIVAALAATGTTVPAAATELVDKHKPTDQQQAIADSLKSAERASLLLGITAQSLPQWRVVRELAQLIAQMSDSKLGYLSDGCNGAGAWLAGCVPHRGPAGKDAERSGRDLGGMLGEVQPSYILYGVEPEYDGANPGALRAVLSRTQRVLAFATHASELLRDCATVLLPLGALAEIDGTYVNAEGRWQSFTAAVPAPGEARAGWKVLRMLANRLQITGFDYLNAAGVRSELRQLCDAIELDNSQSVDETPRIGAVPRQLLRVAEVPIYAVDAITRHAAALQQTADAESAFALLSSLQADKLGVQDGDFVSVRQDDMGAVMAIRIDESVPNGCVWIGAGLAGSRTLGAMFAPVTVEKA